MVCGMGEDGNNKKKPFGSDAIQHQSPAMTTTILFCFVDREVLIQLLIVKSVGGGLPLHDTELHCIVCVLVIQCKVLLKFNLP